MKDIPTKLASGLTPQAIRVFELAKIQQKRQATVDIPKDFTVFDYVVIGGSHYHATYKLWMKQGMPYCYLIKAVVNSEDREDGWVVDESGKAIAWIEWINYGGSLTQDLEPPTARCCDYIT